LILCWRLAHQIPEVPTVNGWTRVQSGVSDFAWQSAGIKKITGWLAESQLKSGQEDGTSSALGCRLWSTSPMTVNEQEKHALTEAHPSSVGQAGPHRHCCCSFPPGCPLFRFTGGLLVRHHHRHCNAIDARGRSTDFRSSFHWNGCRSRRRRPSRCLFSRQCSCARNSRLCYGCYLCAPSRGAGNLSLCEHHLATRGESGWLVAVDRFFEVSIGIGVGLVVSAVWPESKSEVSLRNQPEEPGATGTDQKAPKPEISA